MYVQLYGKEQTSEVRLVVDAPADDTATFPRFLYDKKVHEECLYYFNKITRWEHVKAPNRIKVSFDQHAAHEILSLWADRAMHDSSLSGVHDDESRHAWIVTRIRALDCEHDRALGLRVSERLGAYITGVACESAEEKASRELRAQAKLKMRGYVVCVCVYSIVVSVCVYMYYIHSHILGYTPYIYMHTHTNTHACIHTQTHMHAYTQSVLGRRTSGSRIEEPRTDRHATHATQQLREREKPVWTPVLQVARALQLAQPALQLAQRALQLAQLVQQALRQRQELAPT
jgi:hypothetical protein